MELYLEKLLLGGGVAVMVLRCRIQEMLRDWLISFDTDNLNAKGGPRVKRIAKAEESDETQKRARVRL